MAYNFIGLVNQICRKVNEVELTEQNFGSAQGFYSLAKDAVNRAIKDINNSEDYWRFNSREKIQLLSANVSRYDVPVGSNTTDFDSFRVGLNTALVPPATGNWWDTAVWSDADTYTNAAQFNATKSLVYETRKLILLDYNEYLQWYSEKEFFASGVSTPTHVVKTPFDRFILYPSPDTYYPLVFDYHCIPALLTLATDTPNIPEKYDFVIFTGAMRDVYSFREDDFNAEKSEIYFRNQIKDMRRREINLHVNVRSGVR